MKKVIKKYKEEIMITGLAVASGLVGVLSAVLYAKYVMKII